MPGINDMSLLDLFLMETGAQCLSLNHELSRWEERGGPDFGLMHRAAHSISGAAKIVDLAPMVELSRALEQAVGNVVSPPTAEQRQLFESAVDLLGQIAKCTVDELSEAIADRANIIANLATLLRKVGAAAPLPLTPPETPAPRLGSALSATSQPPAAEAAPRALPDRQLFQIFIEDAENHLAVLSDNLIQIEKKPTSGPLLESSMRAVHSLKGAARVIELGDIVALAHAMEDLFIVAQTGVLTLGPEHIDTLFAAADRIRDLIRHSESELDQWFASNSSLLASLSEKLRDMAITVTPAAAPLAPPPALEAPAVAPPPIAELGSQVAAPAPPPPGPLATAAPEPGPAQAAGPDRRLRISAQGMGRIFSLASEAMIESRWLPSLAADMGRLKRYQDETVFLLEKALAQIPTGSLPPVTASSLAEISTKLKRCQLSLTDQLLELTEHSSHSLHIAHRLHHEVIANRMQPLSEGLIGLPRLVRDLARKLGKSVRLEVMGAETLIDRDILDKLESPLVHLVTNAIDHGIESPEQRDKLGKSREGTLRLTARHQGGMMNISIVDDGRGLDYAALRRKAVEKRLVSAKVAEELTEAEIAAFLFLPNFTTKAVADSTSGRGVGLDIVYNVVREVRGNVEVSSLPDKGVTFELHLPLTLSIVRALLFTINAEPYALPLVNIDQVVRLPQSEIKEMGNRQYFIAGGKRVGLVTAQQALDLTEHPMDEDTLSIVIMSGASHSYGLIVDAFQGIRELVIHPLSPRLGKLRSISAAAIAENGTPILILDFNDLRQSIDHLISGDRLQRVEPKRGLSKERVKRKRILVVDDSITVREVERKILSEYGFEVETAVDGLDAWNTIRHQPVYDLVVTDIDMPNMDGIELLVHIKGTAGYEGVPVIILSYKDREEDRNRGLDAGADYYLTKSSFHSQALLEAVEDLIGGPGENA